MKHLIYYTFSIAMFTLVFFSCKSNENKTDEINNQIESTSAQVSEEQRKMKEEYSDFKEYALAEIQENDENIEKLRAKINEPGKTLDEHRQGRIKDLKEQNAELRQRLNNYALNTSDWQSFKTKFSSDMNSVGESFKNLFSDN